MVKKFPNLKLYTVNAKMKAVETPNFLKNNILKFQDDLISLFGNKNLKIKKIETLKEKLIIGNRYKVTCLAFLKNHSPSKIILQIYDDQYYFNRNLFASQQLSDPEKKVRVPEVFGIDKKLKTIYREYLEGNFVYDLILKRKLTQEEIYSFTKKTAHYLFFLHNFKFKKIPTFLSKRLNRKIEKIILNYTLKFIKPNIKSLKPILERNLNNLFNRMYYLEKINRKCLIHGDYQAANFVLSPEKGISLMDFDTLEMGNPARDLGRFLANITYLLGLKRYSQGVIEKIENLFLKEYLNLKKIEFKPDLKSNINTYKAEMIQYIILSKIWGGQIPSFRKLKELVNYQAKLLIF